MKQWEQIAVVGVFFLAIGIVLMMWGFQAVEPIDIQQTPEEIIASLDPTFILLLMVGMLLIGGGTGFLACTFPIYKLEKQLPPPLSL
jgi:cell division protein FtsX